MPQFDPAIISTNAFCESNLVSDPALRLRSHERERCKMQKFEFTVNGRPVGVSLDNEETPLLNVLRNELGLMGTKFGCGLDQCGCCMGLIDGGAEKSCSKPVWSVSG